MWKSIATLGLCLVTFPAFCQSPAKYQVATILEIKLHQETGAPASEGTSYDVSVKVGNTIYVARYTPRIEESDARHAAGRDLLVQIGNDTITYMDIMGRSYEVPIVSKRQAAQPKGTSQ